MADDETLRREFAQLMARPATPHVSEETWQALAAGALPAAERTAVASHVVSCAECSAIYRSLRELEASARTFDSGVPAEQRLSSSTAPIWLAVAATAVLAVGLAALFVVRTPEPVSSSEVAQQPPPTAPVATLARLEVAPAEVRLSAERALVTRGTSPSSTFLEQFGAAITPYREGRYAEAASELGAVAAKFPDAYEPKFYGAIAVLLSDGDPNEAARLLGEAAPQAPPDWQDEIGWYRAAALQRAGNDAGARAILDRLCTASSPRQAPACAALNLPPR